MTQREIDQPSADPPPLRWTGEHPIGLINARGFVSGDMLARIGFDTISLWLYGRNIAVIDRNAFRAWLSQPDRLDFITDDTHWSFRDGTFHVRVRNSGGFFHLSHLAEERLKGVI